MKNTIITFIKTIFISVFIVKIDDKILNLVLSFGNKNNKVKIEVIL